MTVRIGKEAMIGMLAHRAVQVKTGRLHHGSCRGTHRMMVAKGFMPGQQGSQTGNLQTQIQ